MSEGTRGIVVAHGALAQSLVEEVERISGLTGVLTPVSNTNCDREQIEQRIAAAAGDRPAVIFVDMPCGSCFFAAMHRARGREDVRVVTGVNLSMLLDFVHHHELRPADGAARAAGKGAEAIRQA
jgi:mannose/fructose-specific phosphotransferase system component IIA